MAEKTITTIRLSDAARAELEKIKSRYNIATSNQAIDECIKNYLPLLDAVEKEKSNNRRLENLLAVANKRLKVIREVFNIILHDPLPEAGDPQS